MESSEDSRCAEGVVGGEKRIKQFVGFVNPKWEKTFRYDRLNGYTDNTTILLRFPSVVPVSASRKNILVKVTIEEV
jgi:hypothetical protein